MNAPTYELVAGRALDLAKRLKVYKEHAPRIQLLLDAESLDEDARPSAWEDNLARASERLALCEQHLRHGLTETSIAFARGGLEAAIAAACRGLDAGV